MPNCNARDRGSEVVLEDLREEFVGIPNWKKKADYSSEGGEVLCCDRLDGDVRRKGMSVQFIAGVLQPKALRRHLKGFVSFGSIW